MANTLAYGFVGLEHLFSQRITEAGTQQIFDAIRQSADEHTRQINGLMASLVERTTDHKIRYYLPGTGTLQPLDEWGNPRPVRESGYYDVAFPIQGGGTAWGDNRVTRALMTVEEANRRTVEALKRDADWVKRHVLAAVLDNVNWTFDDPEFGNLTIEPLANNDTVKFVTIGGSTATDDHYLAQAASISDGANPFTTIRDKLLEHPSNRGPIVVYVPANLRSSIEGLTAFVEVTDPAIRLGANSDALVGAIDPGFGDEVLGFVKGANCWIVEWRALPNDYMFAHARGAGSVLRMREYPVPALQGLFTENHSPDGNLRETRMIRYAGFGVVNRIAACVMRIGNAAYAIPAGFDAPLAV